MEYCVYVHRRKDSNTIIYIGQGKEKRATCLSVKSGRNKKWVEILKTAGITYEIIFRNLTKEQAENIEEDLISGFRTIEPELTNRMSSASRGTKVLIEDWQDLVYYNEKSLSFLSWKNDRFTRKNGGYCIRKAGSQAGSINNKTKYWHIRNVGIHRIVYALCFQECPSNLQVNHIDGNKSNNNIANLELVTALQNVRHAHANGLVTIRHGEDNATAKVTKDQVLTMYAMFRDSKTNQEIADYCKLHDRYVSLIRHGKRWKKLYNEVGEIFPNSFTEKTITYFNVRDILRLIDNKHTNKQIGLLTGIEVSQISRIRNRKTLKTLITQVLADNPDIETRSA